MVFLQEQQRPESGSKARILYLTEETRKKAKKVLTKYGYFLPEDLSTRDLVSIALGVALGRLDALSNEGRGVGYITQIRQDVFDLGALLSILKGRQRPKNNA